MPELKIGNRAVGDGHPVYIIAEAGSNHDRNLDQALRLIDVAADAGADAVKFQTFRADALYTRAAGTSDYLAVPRSIHDIFRDLEMPLEWLPILAGHCRERKIEFLSTPFDEQSADALEPFVAAYKIASYEMTHHGLMQHCAKKGKPVIMSTGTANLDEVREAVEAARAVGLRDLVLLQCTARYPAPLEALNLRTIPLLAQTFGVLSGLSDHSRDVLPGPMAAVALGAKVIEKHFTLSNKLPGIDHTFAIEPHELRDLVAKIRQVEASLGTGEKVPHALEEELRVFARRSVFTTAAIDQGARFTRSNLAVLRAGKMAGGLHPRDFIRAVGRTAARPIVGERALQPEDLGPLQLEQGTVRLRPLALEDAERVVAWRNRPEIHGAFFAETPPTLQSHLAWFQSLQRRNDRLEFIIEETGNPVGTIGLSDIDLSKATAEYGVLLDPSGRGRGVASAASRALLNFAFGPLELASVRLAHFADNRKAHRLYDRLGFVADDPPPPPRMKGGQPRDVTTMNLTRAAWAQVRW
jgi:N-acetylneuraminate synthase